MRHRVFANQFLTILAIGLGLFAEVGVVRADAQISDGLGGAWWQWALSIPTSVNPLLDASGASCMVGQQGSIWYLAGVFNGNTATRICSVPGDRTLFFPVINSVNFNTPNVCGQGPTNIAAKDLRAASAAFVNGASGPSR